MSNDDYSDRTQPPTDRRRREARTRGEVARSAGLVSALVLLAATASLWYLGPALVTEFASQMKSGLTSPTTSLDHDQVTSSLTSIAIRLALVALPILLIIATSAAVANLLQTGLLWAPAKVIPRFDRLDPGQAFARWWTASSWLDLGGSLIKVVLLLGVLTIFVRARLTTAAPLVQGSPQILFSLTTRLMGELAVVLSLSLVVLAIVDYAWRYWQHEQQLKMTIEEVRREQREDEGDPQIKQRRRQIATSPTARSVEEVRII